MRREFVLGGLGMAALAAVVAVSVLHGCETGETTDYGKSEQPVIYGADNRTDVYAYTDAAWRQRALASTVSLITKANVDLSNPNDVGIYGATLQSAWNLCSDQRFLYQPTAAFCSGTLIDDNLVLTAGHCVTTTKQCNNTKIVFNYAMADAANLGVVTSADVFQCTGIVVRQQTTTMDYAVLRIDRAATPRFTPAPVHTAAGAVANNTALTMIGCPTGIPFKIEDGAWVRNNRSGTLDYFIANTDSFGGNSGSGVYQRSTGEIVGILVRGETDYTYYGAPDSCYRVNQCTDTGCAGEESTYVFRAIQALCAAAPTPRLCATTPVCGDGVCNGSETSATCPQDCGAVCGDGACNGGETSATCPADCGSNPCGDGYCGGLSAGENCSTCAADCPCLGAGCRKGCCGDGVCSRNETHAACPIDC